MCGVGLINGAHHSSARIRDWLDMKTELGLLRETVGEMGWISSYKKGNSRKRGIIEEENNDWDDTWNVWNGERQWSVTMGMVTRGQHKVWQWEQHPGIVGADSNGIVWWNTMNRRVCRPRALPETCVADSLWRDSVAASVVITQWRRPGTMVEFFPSDARPLRMCNISCAATRDDTTSCNVQHLVCGHAWWHCIVQCTTSRVWPRVTTVQCVRSCVRPCMKTVHRAITVLQL